VHIQGFKGYRECCEFMDECTAARMWDVLRGAMRMLCVKGLQDEEAIDARQCVAVSCSVLQCVAGSSRVP